MVNILKSVLLQSEYTCLGVTLANETCNIYKVPVKNMSKVSLVFVRDITFIKVCRGPRTLKVT